ncbi:dehydrogenase [Paenibacillus sambharensis]|uniref:Dehydrogenase n=1 Tax=Paenibacillus sambharensis TaxID=1803190 RepID=A0A2W1L772_9BACL|nr:dehydrogenase [Paenibacillus sambharensis]PZD94659.1 dehydrogenase [Paenibacillus sambharensis]
MNNPQGKHNAGYPTARKIRRTCSMELYRTAKRLKIWIAPDKLEAAEKLYYKKVIGNLIWISERQSNRKELADWWAEQVCPEIAELWEVDAARLEQAFRASFGG